MSQVDKARDIYFALRRYAQAQKISLQTAIELYVSERVLYRLSQTPHADDFVLKGAMMLVVWIGNRLRSTRDIDFRGFGSPAPERAKEVFVEAASLITDDGLTFDIRQIRIETIALEKIESFLLPLCLASQNKDEFRYMWFPRTGWVAKNSSSETVL